jgi:hypothetical protein
MIRQIARMVFARRDAVFYGRALDPSETAAAPAGYVFQELAGVDLEQCELARQRGRLARFRDRLEQGYRCAGFRGPEGQVVSYIWIARSSGEPASVRIWRDARVSVPQNDVFFWDCRTAPAHTGRGLYRSALRISGACLAREGARHAWIETEPDNLSSRRGIAAAGFTPVAELSMVDIVGMRWLRASANGRWRRLASPLRLGGELVPPADTKPAF